MADYRKADYSEFLILLERVEALERRLIDLQQEIDYLARDNTPGVER